MKDKPIIKLSEILIEDFAYSVNSDPNVYKTAIEGLNKRYNFDIEEIVKDGRIIKVRAGHTENGGWMYLGKNKFELIKNELDEYYKIVDPKIIRLNPDNEELIRYYAGYKKVAIDNILNELLNKEKNPNTFLDSEVEYWNIEDWFYVTHKILEQPVYILDAIERYPDSIEENQRIYSRHLSINSDLQFAESKHFYSVAEFKHLINKKLAKGINIKPLFYFFEEFISKLEYPYSGVNYIETPLFKLLFSEFLPFYEHGINELNLVPFPEIEKVKNRLAELPPQQSESIQENPDREIEAKPDHSVLFKALSKYITGISATEFTNIIERHAITPGTQEAYWLKEPAEAYRFINYLGMTVKEFTKCFKGVYKKDGTTLRKLQKGDENPECPDSPLTKILEDYFRKK